MATSLTAWSETEESLSSEQAAAIAATGLVSVEPLPSRGGWLLKSSSRVGVAEGDGWDLRVSPRMDVPKLMFLLGYASDPKGWKRSTAAFATESELFPAIASGFASQAARALSPAPIRGYVHVDDVSMSLRGRIRFADQIARTLPLPMEVSYDDHTIDIVENRLLLAAARVLLRFRRIPRKARTDLLRLVFLLDGVSPWVGAVPEVPETRLNRGYKVALDLARLILGHSSISTKTGGVRSSAFSFDMNRVFEDFLSATLSEVLNGFGGDVRDQDRSYHLDREAALGLIPDISWWKSGRPIAVIDAKYKRLEADGFPNADAYQMLAYCTRMSLEEGFLVYAHDDKERPRNHQIRNTDVTVKVRTIDVELEPEGLLAQVSRLAEEILKGCQLAHDHSADPATLAR